MENLNKRQLQKKKTRNYLLEVAKTCFIKNGFLKTTTSEIAEKASVAHGTLFLHFKTKEALIVEILDKELEIISHQINKITEQAENLEQLLEKYLDFLEEQEDLFSVLARELPFYSEELRRKILFRESVIREHFHRTIEDGINKQIFRACEVSVVVTFLFATINYYLSLKPIFVETGSVIKKFRKSIVSTFFLMLEKEEN
ncbi:MAG: hypothetical protein DRZ79_00960 [Candidatus Cloacimonadota bacterium]|nr:MAG: hypothetical protein DRZ79_00960 [Candidatus Cloacimonadota bacterium]